MIHGYLRTSTDRQCLARQIDGLRAICDELHVEDGISATARQRPVYDALLETLQPGDTFAVWDLDRAFRSTLDAIQELERMKGKGVEFRCVTLNIDTTTPAGMLIYTVVAALAEWERNNLSQRTKEGLAAARRRGVRLGRPPKLSERQICEAKRLWNGGKETLETLGVRYGVSPMTVKRAIRGLEADRRSAAGD